VGAAGTPGNLTAPARPPRPLLASLTGLRFVAAFHVLVFHATAWETWDAPSFVRGLAGSGYVAVSLFFVLSGFILTYAHAGRRLATRDFYANRFARIYPTYLFALAIVAPLFLVHTLRVDGGARLLEDVVSVVTLTQAWWPPVSMAWNPPGWSLSAEAFFYLLFPLVAPALVTGRRAFAVTVGVAGYAACLGVTLLYMALLPDGPITLSHHSTAFWLGVVRYDPAVRFPEFVLGIVVARGYLGVRETPRYEKAAAAVSVLAALAIATTLAFTASLPYPVLHNGLLAPLFALLIASLAAGRGPLAALLATRPLVALGDASYALYLVHLPLMIVYGKIGRTLRGDGFDASRVATAIFMVLAVVASLLCHRYVELPARDLVLRWWRRRRPAGAA
jgi:peptidoglycan/LPS O-acetylase OafA/YrhL